MADNFLFSAVYCGHFGGERTFSVNEQKLCYINMIVFSDFTHLSCRKTDVCC